MNEPAFPQQLNENYVGHKGMTLLDYFAAKALQGMWANDEQFKATGWTYEEDAKKAYDMAEAMMAEREKRHE